MLCSVVEQAGSGRARKKSGKNTRRSRVFFLSPLLLPACFISEQGIVEASLFFMVKNPAEFSWIFKPNFSFQTSKSGVSVLCSHRGCLIWVKFVKIPKQKFESQPALPSSTHALFPDKALCFSESERSLYGNFIVKLSKISLKSKDLISTHVYFTLKDR